MVIRLTRFRSQGPSACAPHQAATQVFSYRTGVTGWRAEATREGKRGGSNRDGFEDLTEPRTAVRRAQEKRNVTNEMGSLASAAMLLLTRQPNYAIF